jgi:hypothetical protein
MEQKKRGWINKEGGSVKSWKKRYLVIGPDKLEYFVEDKMKTKKGEILFSQITGIKRIKKYDGKGYIFGLTTSRPDHRMFVIQGSSDDDVLSWISDIEAATKVQRDPTVYENEKELKGKAEKGGKGEKGDKTPNDKTKAAAKSAGKAIVKTLDKLTYKGFKSTEMPEIDAWFDALNEVMEVIIKTGEACDQANQGLLQLLEAQELVDANVEDKTVAGVLKYFVKATKLKNAQIEVGMNDDGSVSFDITGGSGPGWLVFEAVKNLIEALNTFVTETPTVIPKIVEAVEQSKEMEEKIQNGVSGLNPLKAGKALKNSAENMKSLAGIPSALKSVLESVIGLVKTIYSILKDASD